MIKGRRPGTRGENHRMQRLREHERESDRARHRRGGAQAGSTVVRGNRKLAYRLVPRAGPEFRIDRVGYGDLVRVRDRQLLSRSREVAGRRGASLLFAPRL